LYDAGYTLNDLKQLPFPTSEFCAIGIPAAEMKRAGFKCKELKDGGYSAAECKGGDFGLCDLKHAQYPFSDLESLFDIGELLDVFNSSEFGRAGLSVRLVVGNVDSLYIVDRCRKMKEKGFTASQLREAGVPYKVCRRAGYSRELLESEGYSMHAFLEKFFCCFYGDNSVAPS
jgi:intracellular multiplication protein IcmE